MRLPFLDFKQDEWSQIGHRIIPQRYSVGRGFAENLIRIFLYLNQKV